MHSTPTTSSSWLLGAIAAVLLLVGCPTSEEDERRAATLTFLASEPTPSSLAVLHPGAADKLAEIEPEVADEVMRDRLVRALVLANDERSHEVLLDVLLKDSQRTTVAFATAKQYQLLPTHLDLLYDGLEGSAREDVFTDICWPSFKDDPDGILESCQLLWAAEPAATQDRWLRLFTHVGPRDDPQPYENLRGGLSAVEMEPTMSERLDDIIQRVAGGEVIPDNPASRQAMELPSVLNRRGSRMEGVRTNLPSVGFDGGTVEIIPPDPSSEFGKAVNLLMADLPLGCAAAWGAATSGPSTTATVDIRLQGKGQAPAVSVLSDSARDDKVAAEDAAAEEAPRTPQDDLADCISGDLAAIHASGSASWVPRFGTGRLTLRASRGRAGWQAPADGQIVLGEQHLKTLSEALRESTTGAWRERLKIKERDELPLGDLGSTDLGFCLAYVGAGWEDCAVWLGEVAALEPTTQEALRLGLRDVDPSVRKMCRLALAVSMDEESIEEAAQPPAGDDDSAEESTDGATRDGAPGSGA